MKYVCCIFVMCVAAVAQQVTVTANDPVCLYAGKQLLAYTQNAMPQEGWRWTVICAPALWEEYRRTLNLKTNSAFSVPSKRRIFIYVDVFDLRKLDQYGYSWQAIADHEIGHIVCKCDEEQRAHTLGLANRKRVNTLLGKVEKEREATNRAALGVP